MNVHDEWNILKKNIDENNNNRSFRERDIFYINMGKNVGNEQNGKGINFIRPIIILKKLSNKMLIGIPLTSQTKEGTWYFKFDFTKNNATTTNTAILIQIKMFSTKRLLNRIGRIRENDFNKMKSKFKKLI